jgi:hypothetical protein
MLQFRPYETGSDGVTGCLAQQFEAGKILLEELVFLFPISNIPVWNFGLVACYSD